MKKLNYTVTVLTVFILAAVSFGGTYSGGSGDPCTPYQIGNVSDWQELMTTTADWDKQFIMIADVNSLGIALTPVGNSSPQFTGIFDGQGHIISNAVINLPGSNYVGLFGLVQVGAQIHNLGVENINVTGNSQVGGLVGQVSGTITSCYATGSVSGNSSVGGLVGVLWDTMSNCYSSCSVSGNSTVGGLGGRGGTILSCYATGAVTGSDLVGGLWGMTAGPVTSSFWDIQTSGQSTSTWGTGAATVAMQDPEIYLRALWDFKGEIRNGTNDTWAMPQGGGYPVLAWQLDASPVSNDEMGTAYAVTPGSEVSGTTIGASGLDITGNGYNDSADVWYYFDCSETDKYTVTVDPNGFDSTLAVFNEAQREVVFNDDFFGDKSAVILKANDGQRYYIRVAGHDGQTGNFNLTIEQGAIQAIQGDLNYDGFVNLVDFVIMASHWLVGISP